MRLKRIIDVKDKSVKFNFDEDGTYYDASVLKESNIVMVCEGEDGSLWVEREPFAGRETDFDHVLVENIFSAAWTKMQAEKSQAAEVFDPDRTLVTTMQLMVAINEMQLSSLYEAWESSPDRTFLEKSSLKYSSHYSWNDPVLQSMCQGMNLNEADARNLFSLARSIQR